jgi:hypothetical protein
MTTSLGGSSGITFPDNTNLPVGKVSTIFTPKITNVSNQTKILGNVEITGDLGIGLYDRVTHNSACRTYTITLKAEQSADSGAGHAAAKLAGHGSAQCTTTSGSGMLTDPAMKLSPDAAVGTYTDLGNLTESCPGYFAFRNFNVYTYLWGWYPSGSAGVGQDPLLNGIPSFINALQNDIPVKIIVNLESGVVVGSDSVDKYSFDTIANQYFPGNTVLPYPSGSQLVLNLASNSYIVGKGGQGSDWAVTSGGPRNNPLYNGGLGMRVTIPTTISNNGTIAKGGGGGYSVFWRFDNGTYDSRPHSTGGGGAGFYVGAGGQNDRYGAFATAGTLTTGGTGSGGGRGTNNVGGNLGVAGYTEAAYYGTTPAITGASLITFAPQGNVLGPIV